MRGSSQREFINAVFYRLSFTLDRHLAVYVIYSAVGSSAVRISQFLVRLPLDPSNAVQGRWFSNDLVSKDLEWELPSAELSVFFVE